MKNIDNTLKYLRESLANYLETDEMCKQVYRKLGSKNYQDEREFVENLDESEAVYLESLLEKEINYAVQSQDEFRVKQLNTVNELLL